MKLTSLYDSQIDNVFKKYPQFGGTISRLDLKLSDAKKNKFYVLNMDGEHSGGTHWVLLSNIDPKTVIYFDSFGAPPPENIYKFMKKTGKQCLYNDMQLQDINSSSCGWFDIYVMQQLLKGRPIDDILFDDFTIDPKKNELLLKKYFRK